MGRNFDDYTAELSQAGSPPVFGQTVNPISTMGADYTHYIQYYEPSWIFRPCDGPALVSSPKQHLRKDMQHSVYLKLLRSQAKSLTPIGVHTT